MEEDWRRVYKTTKKKNYVRVKLTVSSVPLGAIYHIVGTAYDFGTCHGYYNNNSSSVVIIDC